MATESDVLREFLVKLGFKLDEDGLRKFTGGVVTATKRVAGLAATMSGAATAVAAGVTIFASKMEDLYYSSQRTKTSASNILAYRFAIGQLGGTADMASQTLDNLAGFIRNTPSAGAWLHGFGVDIHDTNGNLKQMDVIADELGKRFNNMDPWLAKARAGIMGIDEATLLVMKRGGLAEAQKKFKEMSGQSGFNADRLAEDSKNFKNSIREITAQFSLLAMGIESALVQRAGPELEKFKLWFQQNGPAIANRIADVANILLKFLEEAIPLLYNLLGLFVKLDEATDGWSTRILALAAAFKFLGLFKLVGVLTSFVSGIGAAATATAGATTGAVALDAALGTAAVTAGGLLAALTAIGGVVLAGAGSYWLGTKLDEKMDELNNRKGKKAPSMAEAVYDAFHPDNSYTPPSHPTGHGSSGKTPVNEKMRQAIEFFQKSGWSAAQSIGLAANIMRESTFNEKAEGDHGAAYGLGQWHADRQADFAKIFGHGIRQSTLEEQLQFMHYELTQGKWKRAGNMLRKAGGAYEAAGVVSNFYEIPKKKREEADARGEIAVQISQSTTIQVHGNADPHSTAREVAKEQSVVNGQLSRNMKGAVLG